MKSKTPILLFAVIVAGLLLSILAGTLGQVEAERLAAPTPVVSGWNADNAAWPIIFWEDATITADGGSTPQVMANYEAMDLQYIIDISDTNTITLKLQYSNDLSHWTDGPYPASTVVADANGLNQQPNFGIYTRLYADVVNATPVVVSAIAVAK